VKIRSRYAEAYNNRGMARHALEQFTSARNDFDEAIRDFTQAIERNPGYLEAYLHRAMAYQLSGQADIALADIEQVLKIKPGHPDALRMRQELTEPPGN